MRSTRLLPLAAVAALALAGCGRGGPAYGPPPGPGVAVVELTNTFSFAPETVRVPVGGTVEWRNVSVAKHDVTADPARSRGVSLPAGATPFASGDVRPGEVYRATFTVPGTYRYVCARHESIFGMTGTVEVVGP